MQRIKSFRVPNHIKERLVITNYKHSSFFHENGKISSSEKRIWEILPCLIIETKIIRIDSIFLPFQGSGIPEGKQTNEDVLIFFASSDFILEEVVEIPKRWVREKKNFS